MAYSCRTGIQVPSVGSNPSFMPFVLCPVSLSQWKAANYHVMIIAQAFSSITREGYETRPDGWFPKLSHERLVPTQPPRSTGVFGVDWITDKLAQEVVRGMREAASRGFWVASRVPYGYRKLVEQDGAKKRPTWNPTRRPPPSWSASSVWPR